MLLYRQWGVVPEKVGDIIMSVRGLVSVVIGVVAFVVIDSLITNISLLCKVIHNGAMVSLSSNRWVNWRLTRWNLLPC